MLTLFFEKTANMSEPCIPQDPTSCIPNPVFLGYSGSGSVQGPLIYVNYGRKEDFELLKSQGVSFNGSICVARFGSIYRGNKPVNAQAYGAVGTILFIDPGLTGYLKGPVYPDGPWSTPFTVQRGSVWLGDGDPTTMGWPSTANGPRYTSQEVRDPANTFGAPLLSTPVNTPRLLF